MSSDRRSIDRTPVSTIGLTREWHLST